MRSLQTSFSSGELSPALHARVDAELYAGGLKTCRNFLVLAQGGAANRPGTAYVGPARYDGNPARLVPFRFSAEENCVLEFGGETVETEGRRGYMRVIANGGYVTTEAKAVTDVTRADPAFVTCPGHGAENGDHVWLEGISGMTRLNGRFFRVTGATPLGFALEGVDSTRYAPYLSGGSCERVFELATPYLAGEVGGLAFAQSADILYLAHPSHPPKKLTRTGYTEWTLAEIDFTPEQEPPPVVTVTPTPATGSTRHEYKVSAVVGAFTGLEESLPMTAFTTVGPSTLVKDSKYVTVAWEWETAPPASIVAYRVYKAVDGVFTLLREVGPEVASVVDDGTAVAEGEKPAPLTDTKQFQSAGDYPCAVGFHEQRLWWGGSDNAPHRVWASRSADFENMAAREPRQADDPLTFQLATNQVNRVRHLVSLKALLLFTSGAEFRASGGDAGITPSAISVAAESYLGASPLRPLVIGETALFVQDKGERVHDFSRGYDSGSWSGSDLTMAARHLFAGRELTGWDWAQAPFGLVWVVRDDGQLLTLTFQRDHGILAWARHDSEGGAFESVAVAGEGQEDAVYFIVRREVEGRTVRCVERLSSRFFNELADCFFVDSGLSYAGEPTTVLTGLDHLEGREVAILADGDAHPRRTVTEGRVTLQYPVTRAAVGLPITSDLETLPLSLQSQGVGRQKQVSRLHLRVEAARGLKAGPSFDALTEVKQRTVEPWSAPTAPATGLIELNVAPSWNAEGRVCIRQTEPLPLTVLAITTEVSLGN